jgi:hypothetical protein
MWFHVVVEPGNRHGRYHLTIDAFFFFKRPPLPTGAGTLLVLRFHEERFSTRIAPGVIASARTEPLAYKDLRPWLVAGCNSGSSSRWWRF